MTSSKQKYPTNQLRLAGYFTDVFGLHNDASVYVDANIIYLGQVVNKIIRFVSPDQMLHVLHQLTFRFPSSPLPS